MKRAKPQLRALREKITSVPDALAKLDSALQRLTYIHEGEQILQKLERVVSPLVYAQDYAAATKACRAALGETFNPYVIKKLKDRIEEIERLRSVATSTGTSEEIQSIMDMARKALAKGDRTGAMWIVRSGLDKAPRSSELLGMSALCNVNLGKPVDARRDAEEALKIDPKQGEANFVKGYSLINEGLNDEAIAYLDRAIENHPTFGTAYIYRAYAYYNLQRYVMTLNDAAEAEKYDRRSGPTTDIYRIRVQSLQKLGRIDEAIEQATRWIALQGWCKQGWTMRGDTYLLKGDQESAKRDYEAALRIDPADSAIRQKIEGMATAGGGRVERDPAPKSPATPPPAEPPPVAKSPTPENDPPFSPPPAENPPKEGGLPWEKEKRPAFAVALEQFAAELGKHDGALNLVVLADTRSTMAEHHKQVGAALPLTLAKIAKGRKVQVALATFSSTCKIASRWESSFEPIGRELESLTLDPTAGPGKLMHSVEALSGSISVKTGTRVMLVITSAVGADRDYLENAIAAARGAKVKVFIIGPEAPFSWPHRYETTFGGSLQAIEAGPDSAHLEILQVSPIGRPVGYKASLFESKRKGISRGESVLLSDPGFDTQIGSGYGPYSLERLARETGGAFYLIERSEFDATAVRWYAPDWCSQDEYDRLGRNDRLRRAIVTVVCQWPMPEGHGNTRQQLEQWKSLPHYFDRGERQQALKDARRLVGRCEEQLGQLDQIVKDPATKKASKRWLAHLDLVRAQLAVIKHYLLQYERTLSEWNPTRSVQWGEVRSGRRHTLGEVDIAYEDACKRLRRVVDEHVRTPWAETAWRHLRRLGAEDPMKKDETEPGGFTITEYEARPAGGVRVERPNSNTRE